MVCSSYRSNKQDILVGQLHFAAPACVLACGPDTFPCTSSATFTGCTSRSALCKSGLTPSVLGFCGLLIGLTNTGLHHRCLGCVCVCVCLYVPPASPQQDCQSVCDHTPTLVHIYCFLTITPPPHPFTVFNILIKSAEDMFRASK